MVKLLYISTSIDTNTTKKLVIQHLQFKQQVLLHGIIISSSQITVTIWQRHQLSTWRLVNIPADTCQQCKKQSDDLKLPRKNTDQSKKSLSESCSAFNVKTAWIEINNSSVISYQILISLKFVNNIYIINHFYFTHLPYTFVECPSTTRLTAGSLKINLQSSFSENNPCSQLSAPLYHI